MGEDGSQTKAKIHSYWLWVGYVEENARIEASKKSIQEYTKEFYQVLIRTGHAEANKEKVSHYINGLRPSIQEEISLVQIISIEEAY